MTNATTKIDAFLSAKQNFKEIVSNEDDYVV